MRSLFLFLILTSCASLYSDSGIKPYVIKPLDPSGASGNKAPADEQAKKTHRVRANKAQIRRLKAQIAKGAQAPAPKKKKRKGTLVPGGPKPQPQSPDLVLKTVDLRSEYKRYGIGVNAQGVRPSCVVFSVLGVLEYELSQQTQKPQNLSEAYLIWATLKYLRKDSGDIAKAIKELQTGGDFGFSFMDVTLALSQYGVATILDFPNKFVAKDTVLQDPPAAVIEKAKKHRDFRAYWIEARSPQERIDQVIGTLNLKHPLAVGVTLPKPDQIGKEGMLSDQAADPTLLHAVVLVGYISPTKKIEDAIFIFRNSWGNDWGKDGYGFIRYPYMLQNLRTAFYIKPEVSKEGPPVARDASLDPKTSVH